MNCKPPRLWIGECKDCGKGLCIFSSKPDSEWRTKKQTVYIYSSKGFTHRFTDSLNKGLCECGSSNWKLSRKTLSHREMILIMSMLKEATDHSYQLLKRVNNLRTYIEPMGIDRNSLESLYSASESLFNNLKSLYLQRLESDVFDSKLENGF